jgi:hypothetical protein
MKTYSRGMKAKILKKTGEIDKIKQYTVGAQEDWEHFYQAYDRTFEQGCCARDYSIMLENGKKAALRLYLLSKSYEESHVPWEEWNALRNTFQSLADIIESSSTLVLDAEFDWKDASELVFYTLGIKGSYPYTVRRIGVYADMETGELLKKYPGAGIYVASPK